MQSNKIFISEMDGTVRYYLNAVSGINNSVRTILTTYPTTEGVPMSDHAYREPYSISLSLISSEFNKSKNLISDDESAEFTTDMAKIKSLLFNWRDGYTRLVLQTRHQQYQNMVITNIQWNDNDNTLGQFSPTITFSECRVASYTTETLGPFEDDETDAAYSSEKNLGNSNGVSLSTIVGGAAAGAAIGGIIGGGVGAAVGAGIGAIWAAVRSFSNSAGWSDSSGSH